MAALPIGSYSDALDSFYQHVKARILQMNPQRIVQGYMAAQDWPPDNVQLAAFYMLLLTDAPPGSGVGTISNPQADELIQWIWIIKGKDLSPTMQGRSRGDRIRVDMQMRNELYYALYPSFCEKQMWALSNNVWSPTSYVPAEQMFWTRVHISNRLDQKSGILYGTASVNIINRLPQISG